MQVSLAARRLGWIFHLLVKILICHWFHYNSFNRISISGLCKTCRLEYLECSQFYPQPHAFMLLPINNFIKMLNIRNPFFRFQILSFDYPQDGSKSADFKTVYQKGYHVTEAYVLTNNGHPVSIFSEIHSSKEEKFTSINDITFAAMERDAALFGIATFCADRGYDNNQIFLKLDELEQDYVLQIKKSVPRKMLYMLPKPTSPDGVLKSTFLKSETNAQKCPRDTSLLYRQLCLKPVV